MNIKQGLIKSLIAIIKVHDISIIIKYQNLQNSDSPATHRHFT